MLAFLEKVNALFLSPLCVGVLLVCGISYSFRLRFFQFSSPFRIHTILQGDRKKHRISSFRALTVALGGTLGVGNISGVALAIACGGPGAVFWMWVSAFLAMIVKYAETVLSVFYRTRKNGEFHGGPMYYIKNGLGGGLPSKLLAGLFAAVCLLSSLGTGSIVQSSAVSEAFSECFGLPGYLTGAVLALLCLPGLAGRHTKQISDLTLMLVPFMSGCFVLLSLVLIGKHIGEVPAIFRMILCDAFTPSAAGGGIAGVLLGRGVRYGVTRGLFSNEAGCGTSTIAHATADAVSPESQGVWGIIEVFVDTVLLCTLTAFSVLLSCGGAPEAAGGGIGLVLDCYGNALGGTARTVLAFSVFLFAYATVICWAFYGRECLHFFGGGKRADSVYLLLYLASVIYGAVLPASLIWELADCGIYLLLILNTLCVSAQADTVVRLSPHALRNTFRRKTKATSKADASPDRLALPATQK